MANTLDHKISKIYQDEADHCEIGVSIPQFHQSDGTELVSINTLIESSILEIVEAFLRVESGSAAETNEPNAPKNGLWIEPIILTATPSLISVELYTATCRNGAFRNHYTRTLNIDVDDSRKLALADIITDRASAALYFSKYCERTLRSHWDVAQLARWQLDLSGVSTSQSVGFRDSELAFIFAPHRVGTQAIGRTVVKIPFDAAHRFLTDRIVDLLVCSASHSDN